MLVNYIDTLVADLQVGRNPERFEPEPKLGKILTTQARKALHYHSPLTVNRALQSLVTAAQQRIPTSRLYGSTPISEICYESQTWYKEVYRLIHNYMHNEDPSAMTWQAANSLDRLKAELSGYHIVYPDIPKTFVSSHEWGGSRGQIELTCQNGHKSIFVPNTLYNFLRQQVGKPVCPMCRKKVSSRTIAALLAGYNNHMCLSCGTERQITTPRLTAAGRCDGCAEDGMENETVWAAHDGTYAYVWVGRMPAWIYDRAGDLTIAPVWVEVTELEPPEFFQPLDTQRGPKSPFTQYHSINKLDVRGMVWSDPVDDVLARILTSKSRSVKGRVAVPRAIETMIDRGFKVINMYHNPQYRKFAGNRPHYVFNVEPSKMTELILCGTNFGE